MQFGEYKIVDAYQLYLYSSTSKDAERSRFCVRDYRSEVDIRLLTDDPNSCIWNTKDPLLFVAGKSNLFMYCSNDPINYVDPSGFDDWFIFLEIDVTSIGGGVISFGFVYDTDDPGKSGAFFSSGYSTGFNVGIGFGGGYIASELEGKSGACDINVSPVSGTFIFNENGFQGAAIAGGPGNGLHGESTQTWTFTWDEYVQNISDAYNKIIKDFWKLFGIPGATP